MGVERNNRTMADSPANNNNNNVAVVANIKKNISKLSAKKSDAAEKDSSPASSSSSFAGDGGEDAEVTWESLGVVDTLCQAVRQMKWTKPSKIQKEAIPPALQVGV